MHGHSKTWFQVAGTWGDDMTKQTPQASETEPFDCSPKQNGSSTQSYPHWSHMVNALIL